MKCSLRILVTQPTALTGFMLVFMRTLALQKFGWLIAVERLTEVTDDLHFTMIQAVLESSQQAVIKMKAVMGDVQNFGKALIQMAGVLVSFALMILARMGSQWRFGQFLTSPSLR